MLDGKSVPCAPRMPTCVEKGLRGVSHPSNAGARNTLDCPALPADTAPTRRQQRQPAAAPHMATGRLGGSWVPCRAARTGASKRPRSAPVARSGRRRHGGRGRGGGGERKSARRRRLTPRRHRALVGGALGLVREDGGGGAVTRRLCVASAGARSHEYMSSSPRLAILPRRLCVARPARELEGARVEMRLHVGDRDAGGDAAHEREEEEVGGLPLINNSH